MKSERRRNWNGLCSFLVKSGAMFFAVAPLGPSRRRTVTAWAELLGTTAQEIFCVVCLPIMALVAPLKVPGKRDPLLCVPSQDLFLAN